MSLAFIKTYTHLSPALYVFRCLILELLSSTLSACVPSIIIIIIIIMAEMAVV